jgi:hypothetical protein
MRRIKEVLETHDWAAAAAASSDDNDLEDFLDSGDEHDHDHEDGGFKFEVDELEREMMGLRFAIQNGGDDGHDENDNDNDQEQDAELKVEELEALMMRMHAIKGMLFFNFSTRQIAKSFQLAELCAHGSFSYSTDMSTDLPESQRKAFASKAIRDLMREL